MLVLTQRPDEEIVIRPSCIKKDDEIIIRKSDRNNRYTRIAIQAPSGYSIFRRKIKE
jgi:sRNA-binding carbon storage regulator CsrA